MGEKDAFCLMLLGKSGEKSDIFEMAIHSLELVRRMVACKNNKNNKYKNNKNNK